MYYYYVLLLFKLERSNQVLIVPLFRFLNERSTRSTIFYLGYPAEGALSQSQVEFHRMRLPIITICLLDALIKLKILVARAPPVLLSFCRERKEVSLCAILHRHRVYYFACAVSSDFLLSVQIEPIAFSSQQPQQHISKRRHHH